MEPGFLKPGNYATPGAPHDAQTGFNGARLPEARKHAITTSFAENRVAASMEPGFLKPGNRNYEAGKAAQIAWLQWSQAS